MSKKMLTRQGIGEYTFRSSDKGSSYGINIKTVQTAYLYNVYTILLYILLTANWFFNMYMFLF